MGKKTLHITVGLPRSGKSTWASTKRMPIVNRDAIRLAVHGQTFVAEKEGFVTQIEDAMVKSLLLAGHDDVIIDATHTSKERRERWERMGHTVKYYVFLRSKDECVNQAKVDGNQDLVPVVERMSLAFNPPSPIESDEFREWVAQEFGENSSISIITQVTVSELK